mmetsp:Transcript_22901/g.66166  ORF Transcript_22901/g.66166 Transcript_22901/m.66166 type:complete len:421 (+) Transcript_22901:2-1264(+)
MCAPPTNRSCSVRITAMVVVAPGRCGSATLRSGDRAPPVKQPMGDPDDDPEGPEAEGDEADEKAKHCVFISDDACASVSTGAPTPSHAAANSEDSTSQYLGNWTSHTQRGQSRDGEVFASVESAMSRTVGCTMSRQGTARWMGEDETGYRVLDFLGKGSYADVHRVLDMATGEHFAMKLVSNGPCGRDVMSEISTCSKLNHPRIVRLHGYFQSGRTYQLLMDLCTGGNLRQYAERHVAEIKQAEPEWNSGMDTDVVARMAHQMLSGLSHVHQRGVIHRDVKPQNYLLVNQNPDSPLKLADFGFACQARPGQRLHRMIGTPSYIAPEVLRGDYDLNADTWSLGVTLYRLCTHRLPFKADTTAAYLAKVKAGAISDCFGPWQPHLPRLRVLVFALLRHDPHGRATPAGALADHAWLKDYDYE